MRSGVRGVSGLSCVILLAAVSGCQQSVRLTKAAYLDKCKGAWAGQMIGVSYGAPYEFRFNGKIMEAPIRPWKPEYINNAIGQDDCYVEMTWLAALNKYGLDISYEQAGQAFAESKYGLAHANNTGRENVRHGIMPPLSGDPQYNLHADDIDFQIEADLLGIICPGMPRECNRLGDVFGHVMNYGDGVYGGVFVGGMYCAAYFESQDTVKVVEAGLACIPAGSQYHKCISDVVRWHGENPNDWRATWRKIEERWQDDDDCTPGNPFNIDAKLNGAYIVMGLLYGGGDMGKTLEIATRCGQDNDCNPSSAAGVLGCMKGFAALEEQWVAGIPPIENERFAYTEYSFKTLVPECQRMTERIIERVGGKITDDAYVIPRQAPRAPAKLEQWTNQAAARSVGIPPAHVKWWDSKWKLLACGYEMDPGYRVEHAGKKDCLCVHPVSRDKPAVLRADLAVPAGEPKLKIDIASFGEADVVLKAFLGDRMVIEKVIKTGGKWTTETVDAKAFAGQTVPVRIEIHSNDWNCEAAYLGRIRLE